MFKTAPGRASAHGLYFTAVVFYGLIRGAAIKIAPAVVSVFAGPIAHTGRDPVPHMREAVRILRCRPKVELLRASPRELLNIFQVEAIGCHIVTVRNDIIKKLALVGKDLDGYSREIVSMFYEDAVAAGYDIPLPARRVAS